MNVEETEALAFIYDRRDIASCPWPKQIHLGKCSNGKLHTSTLVNDETLRSTAYFRSPLSSVNNVKISDLLEFLLMLLFSSLSCHPKIICRKLQDFENILGGDFFFGNLRKYLVEVSFNFHLQRCKNILEWLLFYEVTS